MSTGAAAFAGAIPLALTAVLGCSTVSTPEPAEAPKQAAPAAVSVETRRAEPIIESWKFGEKVGECIDVGTHRIHSTLRDPVIRDRLQVFLPTALDHYRSAIMPLPAPDGPIDMFLFGTRSDWLAYTRERLPEEAGMYERLGRGGYTIEGDAVLYDIGRWDTFTIAAHEGWHAYTQRVFRHPLPVWLEEGIACYMEGVRGNPNGAPPTFLPWRNFERFGELRDVVARERFVPLADLVEGTPQDYLRDGRNTLLGYYAQTWALVHFLVEGEGGRYRPGLERLLSDAVEGRIASQHHLELEPRRKPQRATDGDRPAGGAGRTPGVLQRGHFRAFVAVRRLRRGACPPRERRADLARTVAGPESGGVGASQVGYARFVSRVTLKPCSRSSQASIAPGNCSLQKARTARVP
jgi:hypothetical protein